MPPIDSQTLELLNRIGFIPSMKSPLLYEIEIENGKAYVDFRRVDGHRFASVNGKMIEDADSIPILKLFKEERDKIKDWLLKAVGADTSQSSGKSAPGDIVPPVGTTNGEGKNTNHNPPSVGSTPPEPKLFSGVQNPPSPTPIFDFLKDIVGDDLLELFGDTGSGKSKFCKELALEAMRGGKRVFFLDTERNLNRAEIESLGEAYHYTPVFKEIKKLVLDGSVKADLFIIDSVGLPILTQFALLSMKEKGNALLDLIAIVGKLKEWAYQNHALAIVTNQPESEFGKQEGTIRKPFGDKACFAAKEIWRTQQLRASSMTKCSIESFRSRSMKAGLSILQLEITDTGTKIIRS